jgi:hypothetical protein
MSVMCNDGVRDAIYVDQPRTHPGPSEPLTHPSPCTHTSIITEECVCTCGSASAARTRPSAPGVDVRDSTHVNIHMPMSPHATMHTLSRRLAPSDIDICMSAHRTHAPIYMYTCWSLETRSPRTGSLLG